MSSQEDVTEKGGTMRLGAYPCKLAADSLAREAYGEELVYERHRHRFEFNNAFRDQLEDAGLVISGLSPDERLVEMVELPARRASVVCGHPGSSRVQEPSDQPAAAVPRVRARFDRPARGCRPSAGDAHEPRYGLRVPANKEHTEATPSSLAVAAGEYLDYLAVERGLARNTIAAYPS